MKTKLMAFALALMLGMGVLVAGAGHSSAQTVAPATSAQVADTSTETPETAGVEANSADPAGGLDSQVDQQGDYQGEY